MRYLMKLFFMVVLYALPFQIYGQDVSDSYYAPETNVLGKRKLNFGHISSSVTLIGGSEYYIYDYSGDRSRLTSVYGFDFLNFEIDQFVQISNYVAISISYQKLRMKTILKNEDEEEYLFSRALNPLVTRLYIGNITGTTGFAGFSVSSGMEWKDGFSTRDVKFDNLYGFQIGIRFNPYQGEKAIFSIEEGFDFKFGNGKVDFSEADLVSVDFLSRFSIIPSKKFFGIYSFLEISVPNQFKITIPEIENDFFFVSEGGRGRIGIGIGW